MKIRNEIRVVAAVLAVFLAAAQAVQAGESEGLPKKKSVGAAVALGFSPVPGGALFYAGKPVQAVANILLEGLGVGLATYGALATVFCEDEYSDCQYGPVMLGIGVVAFLGAGFWDLAGGVSGVRKHNAKVDRQASALQSFRPVLAGGPNGGYAGFEMKF